MYLNQSQCLNMLALPFFSQDLHHCLPSRKECSKVNYEHDDDVQENHKQLSTQLRQ